MAVPNVGKWRKRYARYGLEGLKDFPRSGRPLKYGHNVRLEILNKACQPPDVETHWSVRMLEKELKDFGIKKRQINKILNELDLKPHQFRMWLFSKDPDFVAKETEIVGLYLTPQRTLLGYLLMRKQECKHWGGNIQINLWSRAFPKELNLNIKGMARGLYLLPYGFIVKGFQFNRGKAH